MAKKLIEEESHFPFYEVWIDDETGIYETVHRDYSMKSYLNKSSEEFYQDSKEMKYIDEETTFEEFIK